MPQAQLKFEGHNIVIRGSFNPKIFQPIWFANQNLIRMGEADAAEIEVIQNNIASFSTDIFKLEVIQNRIVFSTTQQQFYEPLRDLVVGTFRILKHTPLTQIGLNRDFHFLMPDETTWHALGRKLAPQENWEGILDSPGLRSLSMQGKRNDDYKGAIVVKCEPSTRAVPGIFISINDHYEAKEVKIDGADGILDILNNCWEESLKKSAEIANRLVKVI